LVTFHRQIPKKHRTKHQKIVKAGEKHNEKQRDLLFVLFNWFAKAHEKTPKGREK